MGTPNVWTNHEGEKLRHEFLKILESRRREPVPLATIPAPRGHGARFQRQPSQLRSLHTDSCSRENEDASEAAYAEEEFFLMTEAGDQGLVPVLLLKPLSENAMRPVVIFLHSTGASKEMMRPSMQAFAARGYVAVAIDGRYHGQRATSTDSYSEALVSAWKLGDRMPFIYDTVWDIIKLVDYLSKRQDVDPTRMGVLGISLGGMQAWFAAVADPRISLVVPIIGVQSFSWAVSNEKWKARVQSIPHAFEVAKEDMGKKVVDAETVAAVWQRIAPGLMDRFDAEHSIPAISPRPILIISGELDPRCPLKGLEETLRKAAEIYDNAGFPEHFQFKVEVGVEHEFSESMIQDASLWIDDIFKLDQPNRSASNRAGIRNEKPEPLSSTSISPRLEALATSVGL